MQNPQHELASRSTMTLTKIKTKTSRFKYKYGSNRRREKRGGREEEEVEVEDPNHGTEKMEERGGDLVGRSKWKKKRERRNLYSGLPCTHQI